MLMLGAFALFALILAAVGIYGVMSYLVAQGTHDIGVRWRWAPQRGSILRMVVRQGLELDGRRIVPGWSAHGTDPRDGRACCSGQHNRRRHVRRRAGDPDREGGV